MHKPKISEGYVIRNRLLAKLNAGKSKHISLVIAATGYGKSVTVSQWLDYARVKNCWISLDEDLNDFRAFLVHIVTVIRSVFPEAMEDLHGLLSAAVLPPEKTVVNTLINEIDDIQDELILVLDDYHTIRNLISSD